ncbi:DUF1674 domain-containing protein [Henriciella algicola]|jgi:hypothetical protein|uniref:DUF1674 domain-containing protein n=1 Tax=Henriciella algicola TaxID=1608422 RepID=A0A399RNX7_9PROT|nr:DUF1674 domain-containing protein [Henriciella algicola]RIJ31707.1 DUF1674 domain-containing protein [Henriciella algicola]
MKKPLPPEAQRALDEAKARREAQLEHEKALEAEREKETGGPRHREPTRFGDWERKGITYDF